MSVPPVVVGDRSLRPETEAPSEAELPSGTGTTRRRRMSQRAVLGLLRSYQALRSGHPSPCRFYPSCSTYAVEAVEEHGAWRGSWLAVRRVVRCRPFARHGVDLVPPATSGREALK